MRHKPGDIGLGILVVTVARSTVLDNQKKIQDRAPTSRPLCKVCSKNLVKLKYTRKDGSKYYTEKCCSCTKLGRRSNYNHTYRRKAFVYYEKVCMRCGFVPEHVCQLDVDHIDGDKKNNDLENLQILCSNCHRLKTRLAGDDQRWRKKGGRDVSV